MSTLIYCKNSIAANPFYIEEASLNVYSLEELSYYMLNNVYLLSKSFMSVELCNWIGREIKQPKLANELLDLTKSGAPLHIFVGHILASNGYSSQKEIKDLLAIISTFENKSEAECKKMRADRLMQKNKIVDAIYEYESLLSDDVVKTIPRLVEGDIYHNLGCAFAKLFFYDEAVKCFDEAYKRNQNHKSLNCALYAAKCKKDAALFDQIVQKYQVAKADLDAVLETVSTVTSKSEIIEFDQAINELQNSVGGDDMFYTQADKLITEWQNEYTKMCRI